MSFRRSGFSPDYAATTTGICTGESVHWISRPCFYPITTPIYHIHLTRLLSRVSVLGFSPVHFRGP